MFALTRMSRGGLNAANRSMAIARHMMSTNSPPPPPPEEQPLILFESSLATRTYILNRPSKLNALNGQMLQMLRPKIEEWGASDLCGTIVARGSGKAFCAGGDVEGVVKNAADPATRHKAISFFKREFEMDYILAALQKPYVVIMDGFTMGGGVGLSAPATFRIATEKTQFAMPETKIGYCPDVGASFFLSQLDGELGTYLALTGHVLKGREVFELGFATHFVSSAKIPKLLEGLSALENPQPSQINSIIEEFSTEREPDEPLTPLSGNVRSTMDLAFRHNGVEKIIADLEELKKSQDVLVAGWATDALENLHRMSPTSLKVALKAIRKGKSMNLREALEMELRIATAYCNGASPDFVTGVTDVLIAKIKDKDRRSEWSPSTVEEVTDEIVDRFFAHDSPYLKDAPSLTVPKPFDEAPIPKPTTYTLPTEADIEAVITGYPPRGGSTGITYDELLEKFDKFHNGKMGVARKVTDVVERKCEVVDNNDGNFVWLRWKRSSTELKNTN